jgi:hypothetical protein
MLLLLHLASAADALIVSDSGLNLASSWFSLPDHAFKSVSPIETTLFGVTHH